MFNIFPRIRKIVSNRSGGKIAVWRQVVRMTGLFVRQAMAFVIENNIN